MSAAPHTNELIMRYLVEAAPDCEIDDLQRRLRSDAEAADAFVEAAWFDALLQASFVGESSAIDVEALLAADRVATGDAELGDLALPDASRRPRPPVLGFLGNAIGYFPQDVLLSNLIAAVIVGVGLLLAAHVYVSQPEPIARNAPQPTLPAVDSRSQPVCRVTGLIDCRWSEPETEVFDGSHIAAGRRFALASGLLQLTYQSGAKVILQGPCTYEVDSAAGGFLSLGKLTAKVASGEWPVESGEKQVVSGQWSVAGKSNIQHPTSNISNPQSLIPNPSLSTLHSPLFTVTTPTATVTDLGTEFGVEVDKQGSTTSHVFSGSVRLQAASVNGAEEGIVQVIHENESARVEQSGGNPVIVLGPSAKPSDFVRKLVKPTIKTFDLVDVVAGGDGFSGRRCGGIDPTTGRVTNTTPEPTNDLFVLSGDGKYHPVEALPFVDGVFIPNGRAGVVQTDSTGRMFSGFIDSDGVTSGYLWAGGEIPGSPDVKKLRPSELGDVDYAKNGHGLLFLHANKAITFDLDAIRRANPGYAVLRFRSVAGNTERASQQGAPVYADLWVLVDGQSRFQRRQINRYNGAFPVVVPIKDKERFLTLAATDGGNEFACDWILFGDPRLEMKSIK